MRTGLTAFLFYTTILFMINLNAQTLGDYRSAGTGNWGTPGTWEYYDGATWATAASAPSSALTDTVNNKVTIQSGHNVTVAANVTVRNVTVNSGGTLTVNAGASTLTVTYGGLLINGTLTITGNVVTAAPYNVNNINGGTITVSSTGVVNINETAASTSTKGFLPSATWQTGSTLNVNSFGGATATGWGAGGGQNFSNINYAVSSTASFGWGFTAQTISGNVNITSTGSGRLQVFGGSSGTLNILGKLSISGAANFTLNGSSSVTYDTLNIYGNVDINSTGNVSISRGSQGAAGTSICNFYGDTVSYVAGTMNNSTTTPDGAKFRFLKSGTQNFKLVPTTVSGNAIPLEFGTGATVKLLSPVNVTTLYLSGGIINSSSSAPLIMGWWTGSTLTSGNLSAGAPGSSTSYINGPMSYLAAAASATSKTFPIGKSGSYRPVTLSLTPSAATLSTFTAELFNSAAPPNDLPGTLDMVSNKHYFVISEGSGGSAFTAGTLKINYDSDDGVADAANLRIAQGAPGGGGTWIDLGGTGTATTTGSITSTTFTDLTTNTAFTLANNLGGGNPLPVELSSFSANTINGKVVLNWKTATEVNSSQFVVERTLKSSQSQKISAATWVAVGTVNASNNSNTPRTYTYTDNQVKPGTYSYRLKTVDNDGSYSYSATTEATVSLPKSFSVEQNYPNPFNPSTMIAFSLPQSMKVSLVVFNTIGQEVARLIDETLEAGYYQKSFNAGNFPSGTYLYQLRAGNSVLTKKMLLIK